MLSYPGISTLIFTKWVCGGDPNTASELQTVYTLSWTVKPLYGFVIDHLDGKRRKGNVAGPFSTFARPMTWAYMGAMIAACAAFINVFVADHLFEDMAAYNGPGSMYIACMIAAGVGTSIQDVVLDGVVVEWVQQLEQDTLTEGSGADVQSLTWTARFAASAIGGVLGGVAFEKLPHPVTLLVQFGVVSLCLPLFYSLNTLESFQRLGCGSTHDAERTQGDLHPLPQSEEGDDVNEDENAAETSTAGQREPSLASNDDNATSDDVAPKSTERTEDAAADPESFEQLEMNAIALESDAWDEASERFDTEQQELLQTQHTLETTAAFKEQSERKLTRVRYIRTLLFMLLWHCNPTIGVWTYYLVDVRGITMLQLGFLEAFAGMCMAMGAYMYKQCSCDKQHRWCFIGFVQLLGFALGFDALLVVYKVGEGVGGFTWENSWHVFGLLMIGAGAGSVLGGLLTVPVQHAAAQAPPKNKATSGFAVLMAAHNGAVAFGTFAGAEMSRSWGVQKDSYESIGTLMVYSNVLGLATILVLPLLPSNTSGKMMSSRGYNTVHTSDESDSHDTQPHALARTNLIINEEFVAGAEV